MRLQRFMACVVLALSLGISASIANAAVIIRNATGQNANDFHILFSGPADKLKLTSTNFPPGITYPAPSPKQDQIDFQGGTVNNGAQFTINNLQFVKGLTGLRVLSWNFTNNGTALVGEPLIKIGDEYTDLPTLTARGFSVQPVPEPATWALMILGFGLAGAAIRRQAFSASRRPA